MIDRRRFLKLFTGGLVAAAHAGVPALVLRPAVQALDLDQEFASTLYGLLVNARKSIFIVESVTWSPDFKMSFVRDQNATVRPH